MRYTCTTPQKRKPVIPVLKQIKLNLKDDKYFKPESNNRYCQRLNKRDIIFIKGIIYR